MRRPLEARAIKIYTISAEIGTVGQGLPRQGVIAFTHTKETAERHNGVFDTTSEFVDHQVVDRTEVVTGAVVTAVPSTFSDEISWFVSSASTGLSITVVLRVCIRYSFNR
jgi:hypothetical protein